MQLQLSPPMDSVQSTGDLGLTKASKRRMEISSLLAKQNDSFLVNAWKTKVDNVEKTSRTYQEKISSLLDTHPNLKFLDSFMYKEREGVGCEGLSRIVTLEVPSGESSLWGRILLVEDLTRDSIEMLGFCFDIDPHFFAYNLGDTRWESDSRIGLAPMLPSVARSKSFLTVQYIKALVASDTSKLPELKPGEALLCDSRVQRKVGLTGPGLGKGEDVLFVRRKVSVYVSEYDSSWLGVLAFLTEPSVY